MRLLSVLLSVLAIFLLYCWIREISEKPAAALAAAFLMAISPFQYYHAQDLRNYPLLLCSLLGFLIFFTRLEKRGGNSTPHWNWIGLVLCAVVAMYTHNAAIFGLIIPNLYLVQKRRWKLFGQMILAQAVVGVLALPWLLELPQQLGKVQRAWWLWRPGLIDWLQLPVVWSAGLPLEGWKLVLGMVLGLEILAIGALEIWRLRKTKGIDLVLMTAFVLPGLVFIASYLIKPLFVPRVFILASAAYCGLGGWAVVGGWQRGGGKLILGGFLAAALIGIPAQAAFDRFPRSPFALAGEVIVQHIQVNEVVVHDNKLSYFPMRFYYESLPQAFIGDEPGGANDNLAPGSQEAMGIFPAVDMTQAVGQSQGVYFVVFTQAIEEYRRMGVDPHPQLVWLDNNYRLSEQKTFNDLEVFHYVRR
jgi:4-amino-4-deoxy-L-arabinose transferase-like glycosyltransferase